MTPEDGKEEQWWWQWQNVPSRGHKDKDSVGVFCCSFAFCFVSQSRTHTTPLGIVAMCRVLVAKEKQTIFLEYKFFLEDLGLDT
jgi:hypothetical protein